MCYLLLKKRWLVFYRKPPESAIKFEKLSQRQQKNLLVKFNRRLYYQSAILVFRYQKTSFPAFVDDYGSKHDTF